jgi:hypothetical protein
MDCDRMNVEPAILSNIANRVGGDTNFLEIVRHVKVRTINSDFL